MNDDDLGFEAPPEKAVGQRKRVVRAEEVGEHGEPIVGTPVSNRRPFGIRQAKMNAKPRPGWHRCYMNDTADNISEALEADYEFVLKDGCTNSNDPGARIRVLAGRHESGEPLYAYLMEIPQELWEADQAALQEYPDKVDRAIFGGNIAGRVGLDGRYIPTSQGIKIKRSGSPKA